MKQLKLKIGMVLLAATLSSCNSSSNFEMATTAKYNFNLGGEVNYTGKDQLVIDEDDPANSYSRIDSVQVFGYGMRITLPDSLKDCNLKLIIKGKMRETTDITHGSVAVCLLTDKDSTALWAEVFGPKFITQVNTWTRFKDSIYIGKSINTFYSKILAVFPFKNRGAGFHDVDDLTVEIIKE